MDVATRRIVFSGISASVRQVYPVRHLLSPAHRRMLIIIVRKLTISGKTRRDDYKKRFELVNKTKNWAVTMTKVRIRQAMAKTPSPRWHLLTFCGPDGAEARGVVDLLAIRKDHGAPRIGMKRGDAFQMILIQVKGGSAALPTAEDGTRLRAVARHSEIRSKCVT